ncbi:MAG: sugar phosphate isomerase/epimerase family protein [Armatimonadota bacterium]
MKLGLHAFSLLLAGGLREFQPVGRGILTAAQLMDKAALLECDAVQLARRNITDWDMVALVGLRGRAEELGLTLHLSTDSFDGEHLADMIRAANTLGAPQVTVGLSHLRGTVQQRTRVLEDLLRGLDVALTAAKRNKVHLVIENGRHTAAADLAALIQAAQSDRIAVCYDMGNALTVPEDPVESAKILGPLCRSAHLKDFQVYRTVEGVMLVNCPVGDGVVPIVDVLRELKLCKPTLPVFLQTGAERIYVPLLEDEFLKTYPRITARAVAGLLRRGALIYNDDEMRFPHEKKASEREVLKWEEDRLKRSLRHARKLMGTESLTLSLG